MTSNERRDRGKEGTSHSYTHSVPSNFDLRSVSFFPEEERRSSHSVCFLSQKGTRSFRNKTLACLMLIYYVNRNRRRRSAKRKTFPSRVSTYVDLSVFVLLLSHREAESYKCVHEGALRITS